jgi:hypothetical protein
MGRTQGNPSKEMALVALHRGHDILAEMLGDIVEADETFVLSSRKGSQDRERVGKGQSVTDLPDRKARKRGGKASNRGLLPASMPP